MASHCPGGGRERAVKRPHLAEVADRGNVQIPGKRWTKLGWAVTNGHIQHKSGCPSNRSPVQGPSISSRRALLLFVLVQSVNPRTSDDHIIRLCLLARDYKLTLQTRRLASRRASQAMGNRRCDPGKATHTNTLMTRQGKSP